MFVLLFAVAAILVAIAVALTRSAVRGLSGAVTWFLLVYVAFIQVSYLVQYWTLGLPDDGPATTGLLVTTSALFAVAVGSILGMGAGWRPREGQVALVTARGSDRDLVIMAVVILVPAWTYFALLGSVPLIEGVRAVFSEGDAGLGALQAARLERDPNVNPNAPRIPLQGLLESFRNTGTPALFAATLVRALKTQWRWLHVGIMAACVITVLAAGQRWPLQFLVFAALFALSLQIGHLPFRRMIIVGLAAVGAGGMLSVLQLRGEISQHSGSTVDLFQLGVANVLDRAFFGYTATSMRSYAVSSPELQDLGGASYLQSLLAYLPGGGGSYSLDFYRIVYSDDRGFTAPPDFGTELYINWGIAGVMLGGLLWGRGLDAFDTWLARRSLSPEGTGILAVAIVKLSVASTSGVMTVPGILFVAIPVLIALRLFGSRDRPILSKDTSRMNHEERGAMP